MTARVKGWCPSLLKPMRAADGWLLRVKPPGARLSAEAAVRLAAASGRHGNGKLELTQRAGLQLRGVSDAGLRPLAELAIELGLAASDPDVEARRNVMVNPLAGDDPALVGDVLSLAAEIEEGLARRPALAALPDKFGFLVDGGGHLPMTDQASDVTLRLPLARIELAGKVALPLTSQAKAASQAVDIAEIFLSHSDEAPRRLSDLLARRDPTSLGFPDSRTLPSAGRPRRPDLGFLAYEGLRRGAILAAWPFGALMARQLAAAAKVAAEQGDGTLRLTPWRALALPGVEASQAEVVLEGLGASGALFDATAPLLRIEACPGKGACAEATVDTRGLAADLATRLPANGDRVHLSGCAKGCAHRAATAFTLVGDHGRWNVVRDGDASAEPWRKALNSKEVQDLICHA